MERVNGLHHITAIAGAPQENLDLYTGVLGMRLVKRSVNQDDPRTYHLFYADANGHPGTDLTFFPVTRMAAPHPGHGLAVEVSLEVPGGTLPYWGARLDRYGVARQPIVTRFGDTVLPLADPHGMRLALVESAHAGRRRFTAWHGGPVPAEKQIRGLHGAQLWEREADVTARFLTDVLGFRELASENGWTRFGCDHAAGIVDVLPTPEARRGTWGIGTVHHLAWRVDDERRQMVVRAQVQAAGGRATDVIDRFWFKSVYFREPGGVLLELATEGPGLAADEEPAHLGERLSLPPWLEPRRSAIEAALPPLTAADGLRLPSPKSR